MALQYIWQRCRLFEVYDLIKDGLVALSRAKDFILELWVDLVGGGLLILADPVFAGTLVLFPLLVRWLS